MWLLSKAEIWQKYKRIRWGAWAVIMLLISLFSGIIVALQYDYATPWYSSIAIELLVPYGSFFRSLHFYSSQLFFFFTIFHLAAAYEKSEQYSWSQWIRLTASLPVILLLLFTGYILRGDATGSSAGRIAENLLLAIPLIGETINSLLFAVSENGLRKVYLHHVISFDLLLLLLLWQHLQHYRVQLSRYPAVTAAICGLSMVIAAPIEPEATNVHYISGPWFFLGLQELLRYLPPIVAGIITPSIFITALFLFHPGYKKRVITGLFWGWIAAYGGLSITAFMRSV